MLEIDTDLPAGALVDGPAHVLGSRIAQAGGVWLQGRAGRFDRDANGAVTAWRPRTGPLPATPTQPNQGETRLTAWGEALGMQTTLGRHCGLVLPDVGRDVRNFTMALIYRPDPVEEARTLLTLNPRPDGGEARSGSYAFISDLGDALTVKDTGEALSLTLPADPAPRDPRLLIVTFCGDSMAVQRDGGVTHQVTGRTPDLSGGADLFIGARSHRGGLQKTLGQALILDVFFWPASRLLMPATAEDAAQQAALLGYYRWDYGI